MPYLVVEPLGGCVGQPVKLPVGADSIQMPFHGPSHRIQLGDVHVPAVGCPRGQQLPRLVFVIGQLIDFDQVLLHRPGVMEVLGDMPELLHLEPFVIREVVGLVQEQPALPLQPLVGFPLHPALDFPAYLVQLLVHQLNDVEVVIDHRRIVKVVPHPLGVGIAHVHADRLDVGPEPVDPGIEGSQCLAALAVAGEQHRPALHVPDHGHVLLPPLAVNPFMPNVNLIDADDADIRHANPAVFPGQPVFLQVFDRIPVQAAVFGDGAQAHFPSQFQNGPSQGTGDAALGMGEKIQVFAGETLALRAMNPMDCNFEDEPAGADILTTDLTVTGMLDIDLAGAAGCTAVLLAFDSCVVGASSVFRGDLVETFDSLIMVKRAGCRHESLHVKG